MLISYATIYETVDKFLSTRVAMVIMDPYELEALMRFTASVSLNGLSTKAGTLTSKSASLSFVSNEFVMANGFYKDWVTNP